MGVRRRWFLSLSQLAPQPKYVSAYLLNKTIILFLIRNCKQTKQQPFSKYFDHMTWLWLMLVEDEPEKVPF